MKRCDEIISEYKILNEYIEHISYRVKTTHSIWKNIPNINAFQIIDKTNLSSFINDFIGIRWEMKIFEGVNGSDALLHGIKLAPLKHLKSFRNQQLSQKCGFDNEPLIKLCYLITGIPVELQVLSGSIAAYLCAKGYDEYKTKLPFSQKNLLSEQEWSRRLGMALTLSLNQEHKQLRKIMFYELIGEKVDYSKFEPFILDKQPLKKENKMLRFSNCPTPICELSNLLFDHEVYLT